jgi:hypothetical protein
MLTKVMFSLYFFSNFYVGISGMGVHQVAQMSMYIFLPFKSDNLVDPLYFQSQKGEGFPCSFVLIHL